MPARPERMIVVTAMPVGNRRRSSSIICLRSGMMKTVPSTAPATPPMRIGTIEKSKPVPVSGLQLGTEEEQRRQREDDAGSGGVDARGDRLVDVVFDAGAAPHHAGQQRVAHDRRDGRAADREAQFQGGVDEREIENHALANPEHHGRDGQLAVGRGGRWRRLVDVAGTCQAGLLAPGYGHGRRILSIFPRITATSRRGAVAADRGKPTAGDSDWRPARAVRQKVRNPCRCRPG